MPSYCAPLDVFIDPAGGGAMGGAIRTAVLAVLIILGAMFMAARLFKRADWEAYVRMEIWQAVISCFLLANCLFASGVACTLATQLSGKAGTGTDVGHFEVANEYLARVSNLATESLKALITLQVYAEMYSSYTVQVAQPSWGYSYNPLAGFKGIESSLGVIETFVPVFVSSLFAQQLGLQFIQATAFTILLPVGILLRVFSPTREAGAFAIATAFGLFIILPLTYAVYDRAQQVLWHDLNAPDGMFRIFDACYYTLVAPTPDPAFIIFTSVIFNQMCNAFVTIAHIIPQALFLPSMSMVITITFIKALNRELIMKFG
ncbi:hypothetical protein HY992_00450 [Candidatus Micrarchaeota archaeon]|nr:hypothetical protein [Candidatus Micrarchaeota archaeon]